MTKLQGRLIVFFVGIPGIAILIIFLPHAHHLGLIIGMATILVIGSGETVELLAKRGIRLEKTFILPLSAIAPTATYLELSGIIGVNLYVALLTVPFFIVILRYTLRVQRDSFEPILPEIAGAVSAVLYPCFFGIFLIRIASLPYPTYAFLAFFLAVFANDSAAYVFGMLFGKSTRGVSVISPNKSIPGFVAGPIFSILVMWLFYIAKSELFGDSLALAIVCGIAVGAATIIGDLFESVLKRSAGVKDSGILVPGRGGVLDSVDSVAVAAPVFYLLILLFT